MRPRNPEEIVMVDTNVVSILGSRKHSPSRDYYRSQLDGKNLYVSFITVHEVMWGMSIRDLGPERRSEVLADLGKYQIEFPSNELITASVHLRLLFRNRPLSFQDLFVASSALALGCPLATDDRELAAAVAAAGLTAVISRHLPH